MQLGASQSHVNSRGTAPEQAVEYGPIALKWSNKFLRIFKILIKFLNLNEL